ncbi:hypothetical protein FEDK69T_21800 [Flavobacterium enshiense DK69]|uniref:DUF5808 domain-containing protein n=1 Tax=Flavobacterium enshiense DK69 TaxID=1107311 RepID=V6S688_9FLAO|nr:DUF5808 domain-containing protein [Flavobacterium enshiense]ESU22198.1 hypothetical protein FEDK69T_21800 [Flavobacterium enshiense DK69]KGO97212.1 hypothetical protein Q767_00990 [Flavobacterium enshiense DK69]
MENPDKETLDNWHKDPNNWKWGIFYYNPKDTRGMVPKKIEWMGWTINFANTKAVLLFFGMTLFFIFVVTLITNHQS